VQLRHSAAAESPGGRSRCGEFDATLAYEPERWSIALVGNNPADTRYLQPFSASLGMIAPGDYLVATVRSQRATD
jgi:hypothetical protein